MHCEAHTEDIYRLLWQADVQSKHQSCWRINCHAVSAHKHLSNLVSRAVCTSQSFAQAFSSNLRICHSKVQMRTKCRLQQHSRYDSTRRPCCDLQYVL